MYKNITSARNEQWQHTFTITMKYKSDVSCRKNISTLESVKFFKFNHIYGRDTTVAASAESEATDHDTMIYASIITRHGKVLFDTGIFPVRRNQEKLMEPESNCRFTFVGLGNLNCELVEIRAHSQFGHIAFLSKFELNEFTMHPTQCNRHLRWFMAPKKLPTNFTFTITDFEHNHHLNDVVISFNANDTWNYEIIEDDMADIDNSDVFIC